MAAVQAREPFRPGNGSRRRRPPGVVQCLTGAGGDAVDQGMISSILTAITLLLAWMLAGEYVESLLEMNATNLFTP